ncbi:nuclease-related domain-containing protein [Fredinandcohnia sp. 179-A 10B2 NHS]|uniref:nuclease-related domain-containing protein n=1 Tax=Fredinandcohnia sp. 179-A 10B2 NHS TaxID=3235176 RepID=UPI00399F3A21
MKIIKHRTIPYRIIIDEVLLRRLTHGHNKLSVINEDLLNRRKGFKGEQNIDYYLQRMNKQYYMVFHDLRLTIGHATFQIDTLLLSRFLALIIEIKNFSGILTFDTKSNQFTRTYNNEESGFKNPISQASEHRELFINWLHSNNIFNLPVEYVVGISEPSTLIKALPGSESIYQKVLHFDHLKSKISNFEGKYIKPVLDTNTLNQLSEELCQSHLPFRPKDPLSIYGLKKKEIIKGVACLTCSFIPLQRTYGRWYCPRCKCFSTNAHNLSLLDYFVIVNPTITNKQAREFLRHDNRKSMHRLLTSSGLHFTGENKGRLYYPFSIQSYLSMIDTKNT